MADEVIPAGTRTRKVKTQAQPKAPKPSPKKKKVVSARHAGKGRPRNEPDEYEVCCLYDFNVFCGAMEMLLVRC